MKTRHIPVEEILSWLLNDFPNEEFTAEAGNSKLETVSWEFVESFAETEQNPVLYATLPNGHHRLIDGHHRLVVALLLGQDTLLAVDEANIPLNILNILNPDRAPRTRPLKGDTVLDDLRSINAQW